MNLCKISAVVVSAALFAGCSSSAVPNLPLGSNLGASVPLTPTVSKFKTGAKFSFAIPVSSAVKALAAAKKSSGLKTQSVKPLHLPGTSSSFSVSVAFASNATTGTPGSVAFAQNFDATTCPVANNAYTCTVTAPLAPDSYVVDITTYDAPGETGNVLSKIVASPFTVASGAVNSVPITLIGVPASLAVTTGPNLHSVSSGNYEIAGPVSENFSFNVLDADGNVISNGVPPTNITSSNSDIALNVTGPTSGTLTASGLNGPSQVTLSASYAGTTATNVLSVTPVESLYVAGTGGVDNYGMYSTGLTFLSTLSFGQSSTMIVRSSNDGKSVRLLNTTNGTFYSFDPSANFLTTFSTISQAVGAADFALAPNNGPYYVTNRNANTVYRMAPQFGLVTGTYLVSQPIQVDTDAVGDVFVAQVNFNGTIAELPVNGASFNTYASGLYYPAGLRVGNAANGQFVYTSQDNGSGAVVIYKNASGNSSNIGGPQASNFAFDAAGEAIMINGYVTPAVLNFYPPNSATPIAGRTFTFPSGARAGTMAVVQ